MLGAGPSPPGGWQHPSGYTLNAPYPVVAKTRLPCALLGMKLERMDTAFTLVTIVNNSRNKPRLPRRAINLFTALCHFVRWSWRFDAFGFRSRLNSPAILTNTRRVRIGKRVCIWKGARIEVVGDAMGPGPMIQIGDDTVIHLNFHCGAAESVRIGRDVLIAGRVYITDHDHEYDNPALPARWAKGLVSKPVVIEDGVWLGEGCVILKGVTVGKRAVVGANAVVTKDVPSGAIVGGIPARVIKTIDFR